IFSVSRKSVPSGEDNEEAYLATLVMQRNVAAFFDKYDRSELQELLSVTSCSWLQSSEEFRYPVELPSGIINQMNNFNHSNVLVLAPVDPDVSLDYKEVHQIVKELTVGIYSLNQIPSISLDANYDQSTACQLPPAYYDTRVGQILINLDYTIKALWHGAYISKEKRVRFSELWHSSMDVDPNGAPRTKKDIHAEFCAAGLIDISEDPDFEKIYSEELNTDPTYDPNNPEEKRLFMQYSDSFLLKLTSYNTKVNQYKNLFMYDGDYSLSNAVRLTEEQVDPVTYQRLQQRLTLHQKVIKKYFQKKTVLRQNLAYVKLICFLVPLLLGLKKKMKIPDLNKLLPPFSDDKVKTERELPPLLLSSKFTCQHFQYPENKYFHLHGGIEFDVGTPSVKKVPEEIKGAFSDIQSQAAMCIDQLLNFNTAYRDKYPIPILQFNGNSYYVISIELETLYQQLNKWWGIMNEQMSAFRPKRLPMNDVQLHEQFKKRFGYKKAIKCKNLPFGLKATAERGLAAVFYTFFRKNAASCLGVLDYAGYSLVHLAAIHNRVPIICQLAVAGFDLNERRIGSFINLERKKYVKKDKEDRVLGPTALHLAAQCGSLEALTCLLALQVDYKMVDSKGWAAVHFAAFYDNVSCIRVLFRKDATLLDTRTASKLRSTPLLLAATSGAFDAVQYLLSVGADWRKEDSQGNNVVHLATLYFHTEILQYLITLNIVELPVWTLLVEMLQRKDCYRKEMAVRSLEVLCVATNFYWKSILDSGGVLSLVDLLHSDQMRLQCIASAVLCNISQQKSVSKAMVEAGAIPVVIQLLQTSQPELQSRCSVILSDLIQIDNNQDVIAELGAVSPLVRLLHTEIEDVLINAINCIQALCMKNAKNQRAVMNEGAIAPLVELLNVNSDNLQATACAAIAALAQGYKSIQDAIAAKGAIIPLVNIISGRKLQVQMKAAMAIEALADQNAAIQEAFLEKSVSKHLLKLLKVFQLPVREQGAMALWTLAGQRIKQQKMMAEDIGYHFIIDMLLSSSDKMQYVACQAVIALSRNSTTHQNQICEENAITPLVRLLRNTKTTVHTLLSVITALGTMCIGVAHINNPFSQKKIAEEQALPVLIHLLAAHKSLQVKVEVACTLACIVMGNTELHLQLREKGFSYADVLELLQADDKNICLQAGYALALFAYNNTLQQFLMLRSGGIPMDIYESFLRSECEIEKAKAAFQIVVLAKVIVGIDQFTLSARGTTILVQLLKSYSSSTVILAGYLLATLAHTRVGLPDVIVTLGAVELLCQHLHSHIEEVCTASAVALGYLSFNRTAYRILLTECRNEPDLYKLLTCNLSKDAKINKEFTDEFRRQQMMGLPSQSLVINGGPPVFTPNYRGK
uniref:Ankyrin and armadillo repeat containing n=1 Tax=Latimeria chalumnae TaxID=7897 RepID=H3B1Q7_LATCH